MRSYTELVDPNGGAWEYHDCFKHTQGDFEDDKVCFGIKSYKLTCSSSLGRKT
jgi:hypothetical protein